MTHPDMTEDLGPLEREPVNHRPPFAARVPQDLPPRRGVGPDTGFEAWRARQLADRVAALNEPPGIPRKSGDVRLTDLAPQPRVQCRAGGGGQAVGLSLPLAGPGAAEVSGVKGGPAGRRVSDREAALEAGGAGPVTCAALPDETAAA